MLRAGNLKADEPREADCHEEAGTPHSGGASSGPVPLELRRLREEQAASARVIRELREALAARDAFIATAGHELRNPMGAIVLGVTYMLHQARSGPVPGWLLPRLESLDRQTRSFVRRATTLLDVGRLTHGGLKLELSPTSLPQIARDVVHELGAEADRARCRVTLEVESGVEGHWDRVALEQLAFNLLSNAIKFGAGLPVEVRVRGDADDAYLVVRDHGPGISEEDRERIFDRFERVATRSPQPGFGLGLWIAREIVHAHGGEIRVESAPGDGSIFTARVPRGIPKPRE